MEKKLSVILPKKITNNLYTDFVISGMQLDSRKIKSGDLFFALPGLKEEGSKFLADAFARGAICALVPEGSVVPAQFRDRCISVKEIRLAMAETARNFYDNPALGMKLVGVTGTKGKTSTTYLMDSIFHAAGYTTSLLGTVECRHPGGSVPSSHTTREAIDIYSFLADARKQGVNLAAMEVSSHAFSFQRVWGMEFEGVIFTNLSPDHLDYYKTMEPYYEAKRNLFLVPFRKQGAPALINADNEYGVRLLKEAPGTNFSYGKNASADYQIVSLNFSHKGGLLRLKTRKHGEVELFSPLIGDFNSYNIAGAAGLAFELGCSVEAVKKGLASLNGVPGRLERVPTSLPFSVFVDFAHSGVALEQVLKTLKPICEGRLTVVVGAGGDRDPVRRETLGAAAGQFADFSYITSDNPRTEDPAKIIAAVKDSFLRHGGKAFSVEADRLRAIELAVNGAREGDIICIAGKGHETGQIIGTQTFPFDDRIEAGKILRVRERAGG